MNPLALSPEAHAALYEAARERADGLRRRAIDDFLAGGALRRLTRWVAQRLTAA